MVNNCMNLKKLNIDELVGVVNLFPWFGAARMELCSRMFQLGGEGWGEQEFAKNAMYIASRRKIFDLMRTSVESDYSDKDMSSLLKTSQRKVKSIGGDFFTQDEYDSVKHEDDRIFSTFAAKVKSETVRDKSEKELTDNFCTETLAQIYVEQGYYEQAKFIYSKLMLRYPEKNAYFASLIDKLAQLADN